MAATTPGCFPDLPSAFTQHEIDSFQPQANIASKIALKPILAHVLPFVLK